MLKSYLLENYGYNEPIFLNDLKIEELSENAVRQSVKRLVANGFLERYDNGIYYIPKHTVLSTLSAWKKARPRSDRAIFSPQSKIAGIASYNGITKLNAKFRPEAFL